MVAVFKTNVAQEQESEILAQVLLAYYPTARVTFDLDDCDRVLRIEEATICCEQIIAIIAKYGYSCEALPDTI